MKLKTLKKVLSVVSLVITVSFAVNTNAYPVFSFTNFGGFQDTLADTDYSDAIPGDTLLVPEESPLYSTISWGTDSTKNSLKLKTETVPTILPESTWTTFSTLTFANALSSTETMSRLQHNWWRLRVTDADGAASIAFDYTYPVAFLLYETADVVPCEFHAAVGTICDDVISILSGFGNPVFAANDGSFWTVFLRVANPINTMESGNFFYTGEGMTSSVDLQIMIDRNLCCTVPEPGTLGILSLGLLGLASSYRRKQKYMREIP